MDWRRRGYVSCRRILILIVLASFPEGHRMVRRALFYLAAAYCLFVPCSANAEASNHHVSEARIFSDMMYVPEAGDVVGDQIIVIPYSGGEAKIVWQSAQGDIRAPVLLDVQKNRTGQMIVIAPKFGGKWVFDIKGNVLLGKGTEGRVLKLKEERRH
jgi:hypothetical protein